MLERLFEKRTRQNFKNHTWWLKLKDRIYIPSTSWYQIMGLEKTCKLGKQNWVKSVVAHNYYYSMHSLLIYTRPLNSLTWGDVLIMCENLAHNGESLLLWRVLLPLSEPYNLTPFSLLPTLTSPPDTLWKWSFTSIRKMNNSNDMTTDS